MTDVIVVGAGPTGLTLAVDLVRGGVDTVLLEAAPEPHRHSRGKGLQPRTLEVLDDLGVVDRVLAHGEWRQDITLYADHSRLARVPAGLAEPRPDLPYPNLVMIPQWRTTEILADRLRELGGEIRFDARLERFAAQADGVRAMVVGPDGQREELTARYLVGCDGGRSTVRRALRLDFAGVTRETQRYLLGDVTVPGWPPEEDGAVRSYAWFGSDDSFLGRAGLPGTGLWQIRASIATDDDVEPSVAALQRLWEERTGRPEVRLADPTWLSNFRVNVRMVDTYRRGRVFVAGDAAHVHPPTGGQGMNTGIQDAYNLGWKLAVCVAGANDALLDTYDAERRPVAREVLEISTDILDVVTTRNPLVAFAVRRVLLPLLSNQRLNRALTSRVSQIDVGYRDVPLSRDEARGGRVRAGDRAPDVPLLDTETGEQVRLFDVLRGTHRTLLLAGRSAARHLDPAELTARLGAERLSICVVEHGDTAGGRFAGRVLRDVSRGFRGAYRARPGTALLVRPDGDVACRAHAPHTAAVAARITRARRARMRLAGGLTPASDDGWRSMHRREERQ